jgi:hypothetical protein
MPLPNGIKAFGNACEYLLAIMATHQPLTEEEVLYIRYYCKELLEKTSGPPYGQK